MFTDPRNSTFAMPEQQKQIHAAKMAENPRPPPPEQKPIIDFKYYPPPTQPKPAGMFKKPDATNFISTYGTAPYLPGPMDYVFRQQLAGQQLNQIAGIVPPIINYQINTAGPTDLNEHVYMIYEDYLPTKSNMESTYQTIGERMNLQNFIRSTIFNNTDGNNISLDGSGTNSILSHIKFDELNPYNKHRYTNNPFTELPDNFLIYRSCYPIRKSQQGRDIVCAKDATAVNIRLYKMLEGSYAINRNGNKNFADYDEWRDLAFYEYVREEIIRNKMCPNFTIIYGYFISEKSKINYSQINQMKNGTFDKKEPDTILVDSNLQPIMNKVLQPMDDITIQNLNKQLMNTNTNTSTNTNNIIPINYPMLNQNVSQKAVYSIPNPNAYLGKSLVIITESPTYNLLSWASNLYLQEGNIRKMINRGAHNKDEWMNIIFQLIVALYAMQKTGIYINNFSLRQNVFIKDLSLKGQVTNFWKYTIDGIEYYLPNLGYLLVIDSNFADKKDNNQKPALLQSSSSPKPEGKIGGKCLGSYDKTPDNVLKEKVFTIFKKSLDPDNFSNDFLQMGGCKPPGEIITLLSKIKIESNVDKNNDILPYFIKYMKIYTHNRIGTSPKESEIPNIRKDNIDIKKGSILFLETGTNTYKIVLASSGINNGNVDIFKSREDTTSESVTSASLFGYPQTERIQQTFKPNEASMNEEDLLETYIL